MEVAKVAFEHILVEDINSTSALTLFLIGCCKHLLLVAYSAVAFFLICLPLRLLRPTLNTGRYKSPFDPVMHSWSHVFFLFSSTHDVPFLYFFFSIFVKLKCNCRLRVSLLPLSKRKSSVRQLSVFKLCQWAK